MGTSLTTSQPATQLVSNIHSSRVCIAMLDNAHRSFLMPLLSFTESSVNNITTTEMGVKGSLAALKDTSAQNQSFFFERVCSHSESVAQGQLSKSTKLAHWANCLDLDVRGVVSDFTP